MKIPEVKVMPTSIGMGYHVWGKIGDGTPARWICFAYVWAVRVGSRKWWGELFFAGGFDPLHPPSRKPMATRRSK